MSRGSIQSNLHRVVRPKLDVERIWESESVRQSGALIFPDHEISVISSSSGPNINELHPERQLTTSHEDLYTIFDYIQVNKVRLTGRKNTNSMGALILYFSSEISSLTRWMNKTGKSSERKGSGHFLLPDREDSATPLQSKDYVTQRQNDDLQLLGPYVHRDRNIDLAKKQHSKTLDKNEKQVRAGSSDALETPDYIASVTIPSLIPVIEQVLNGTQPVKAHEDHNTRLNYIERA